MNTRNIFLVLFVGFIAFTVKAQETKVENWVLDKPIRLIQTNLREIDLADFNVARYVKDVEEIGANTVLINIGGIVANYPSELSFQFVNPRLKSDIIGEVIENLHEKNIRVIGRFDFSKLNETIAENHPEWLYLSKEKYNVNYNGQVHTCMNGEYQQKKNFEIIEEVINRYPVDGIFINMSGYQTSDYSHNYHGICQSDACRKRFNEWSGGLNLPLEENSNDSVFLKYNEFRKYTTSELYERLNAFITKKNPEIAICTYVDKGVDLRRHESATHINKTHTWEYHSTENVKHILNSYTNKQVSNAAVHFMSFAFRHASVSPYLTEQRLIQNIIHGGGLDFYCIGRLDNQEDRTSLEKVNEVFQFHKTNEKYFTNITSTAEIALINTTNSAQRDSKHGFVRFLSENHIQFDMILQSQLDGAKTPRRMEDYKLIILPDITDMSDNTIKRLDAYVKNGGKLLSTGFVSTNDEIGNPLAKICLNCLGVNPEYEVYEKNMGTYLKLTEQDKTSFSTNSFANIDIMYVYDDFIECKPMAGTRTFMKLINSTMFGPPEKCYYTTITDFPGIVYNEYGKGKSVYFPWRIGQLYHERSHYGHSKLLLGAINDLLEFEQTLLVKASPVVEIGYQESETGEFGWFGLLNHSGQLNTAFHAPLPISDIGIKFKTDKQIKSVKLLYQNKELEFQQIGEWVSLVVPQLNVYEIVVIEN